MPNRIYAVTHKPDGTQRLVRASSQSQAINHVVRGQFDAHVATQEDIVAAMDKGLKPETAGEAGAE